MSSVIKMTFLKSTILLISLVFASTSAFSADTGLMASAPALAAKVQSNGSARVIVKLDTQFVTEGALSGAAAVMTQRARINAVQSSVVASLPSNQANSLKQFETVPYIALEVDASSLDSLLNNPLVIGIEEDRLSKPTLLQSVPFINGDDVINSGSNGSGWTVAILDTGVRKTHIDLDAGKVVSEACYSSNVSGQSVTVCPNGNQSQTNSGAGVNCDTAINGCNHGTHVAGIAAGTYGGVAPGASLMAVQVFSRFDSSAQCGSPPNPTPCVLSWSSDQMLGLERVLSVHNASNGISIASANMSLGGGSNSVACDGNSLKPIIDNLRSAGIATVIASGNDGFNGSIGAPSCISSAISVGSTLDSSNTISGFSNHSSLIDIMAPGSNITSSVATTTTSRQPYNGTSMATPHIAGAFAVFRDLKSSATVSQIESAMESTGVNVSRGGVTKPRIDILATALALPYIGSDLIIQSTNVTGATFTPSQTISMTATVKNVGSNQSDASTVLFYISNDSKITTADQQVGTESAPALNSEQESIEPEAFAAPASIGVYYLGACVDTFSGESKTNNNCSNGTRIVVSNGPVSDAFESDNSTVAANPVKDGDMQFRSISPLGDQDWLTFMLQEDKNNVTIRTVSAGFPGDTTVALLYSNGNLHSAASDSGFSQIQAQDLPAGQYFIGITETGNNAQIEGYFLEAEIQEDDDFLLMVVPAIIARVSDPIPPQWGVDSVLCCYTGSTRFSATISGETRSSSLASCSSSASFSGYKTITSGNKSISSRVSAASCGSVTFSTFSTPFDNNFQYLIRAEFDVEPVVRLYRGPLSKQAPNSKVADQALPSANKLELVETQTLELDNLSGEGSFGSVEGRLQAVE